MVQAERLCGKQSLLGEYLDIGGVNGGPDQNKGVSTKARKESDGDEEML